MAMPVLATAAVVTGGWLLISNQRSKMLPPRGAPPGAPSETVGQTEAHQAESETHPGVTPTVREHGDAPTPPPGNDPSTTGSHESGATVMGQANQTVSSDATPAMTDSDHVYEMAWGLNLNGMSKSQQAVAIQQYGSQIGAVW